MCIAQSLPIDSALGAASSMATSSPLAAAAATFLGRPQRGPGNHQLNTLFDMHLVIISRSLYIYRERKRERQTK